MAQYTEADKALIRAAAVLRETNPGGWESFVTALQRHAVQVSQAHLRIATEALLLAKAQGMALEAQMMADSMGQVMHLFEQIRNK